MRRINYPKQTPGLYEAMEHLDRYLQACNVEEKLLHLVRLRASQLNHCAYCIDMHWKDLRVLGEPEQRLYGLDAWREAPYYTERERAALEWTEAVTFVAETGVPDSVYERTRAHFTEAELADLTMAVAAVNAWNRLSISARPPVGHYQPQLTPA